MTGTTTNLHLVLVMDRSGSMARTKEDAEGGLKALLEEQKANSGETVVSLFDFDDKFSTLYKRTPLADVPGYTLRPRGGTALYDAIGHAVALVDEHDGEKVALVVFTDGEENSSREYTGESVNALLAEKQEKGWTVAFVGADQDAFKAAAKLGIHRETTLSHAGASTRGSYMTTGSMISRGTRSGVYGYTEAERDATA